MILYFLSPTPAALRLNGQYVGVIDCFERRVEAAMPSDILAEVIPSDNSRPLNFFINEEFFSSPPDFADVYLIGDDALVKLRAYHSSDAAIRVIAQTRFCDCLVTLYTQGGVFVSCEGDDFSVTELDVCFIGAQFSEQTIGGFPALCLCGGGALAIFSKEGKLVFKNAVKSYSCGDMLHVTVDFCTCAGAEGECDFSFDGSQMKLVSGKTYETRAVGDNLLHFAFFESVLTRGDSAKYLSPELAPRASLLAEYLGNFVDVLVPPQKFYSACGEKRAAGLVYPVGRNLFRVKFFAADIADGKVENIREIDYP